MSFNFCCNIWMVESEFGVNNIKAWLHPALNQNLLVDYMSQKIRAVLMAKGGPPPYKHGVCQWLYVCVQIYFTIKRHFILASSRTQVHLCLPPTYHYRHTHSLCLPLSHSDLTTLYYLHYLWLNKHLNLFVLYFTCTSAKPVIDELDSCNYQKQKIYKLILFQNLFM